MQYLFLAPLCALGAICLMAISKTLYDAIAMSTHPRGVVGLILLSGWLALIIMAALSKS